jgi:hypothetical protein
VVGTVLLQQLAADSDADIEVMLEAANALFDVYGEDHLHVNVIKQLGLLEKLHAVLPVLAQRVCIPVRASLNASMTDTIYVCRAHRMRK